MNLFPKDKIAGVFLGFSEGGLEFHAELVLPYRSEFQNAPMHGQFVAVQLESENEGVLGRITSISSQGRLASSSGEDFTLRAVSDERPIPEDIRQQYLKYRVNIRVLGVVKKANDSQLIFTASHRRLPHVGSKVAFLGDDALKAVAGHNAEGRALGFFALGEFIFNGDDSRVLLLPGMQSRKPCVMPKFNVRHLLSRRSFVFARAGFGKSNLIKLLLANLYESTPTVSKRKDIQVPVGTLVFDPDGEYYWPDDKGRPGLCDVPHLENGLVVFTNKAAPSAFYQSFVVGGIKLDIRRLRPSDVVTIALSPEKQDQQNVRKLKSMNQENWSRLVDEIHSQGNNAAPDVIRPLLRLEAGQEAELYAARANMTQIVKMLHDPSSQLMDMLIHALRKGKVCVVDVSQMRGTPALVLSGLILQKIFDNNQEEFTKAEPSTIPVIAVIEEAQSVLGGSTTSSGEGPYVTWVKEGRKYDLGAILVTQQPGSISNEILSQGDNWFVFHLLSAGDLLALKKANAHFSDDILSALLNEPIVGQGVYWSSVSDEQGGTPYPIPVRVMSFEHMFNMLDPNYNRPSVDCFAAETKKEFTALLGGVNVIQAVMPAEEIVAARGNPGEAEHTGEVPDARETFACNAIENLKNNNRLINKIRHESETWWNIQKVLMDNLPRQWTPNERQEFAYSIMPRALNEIFGEGTWDTYTALRPDGQKSVRWVKIVQH